MNIGRIREDYGPKKLEDTAFKERREKQEKI